jgi:hypothetical protein
MTSIFKTCIYILIVCIVIFLSIQYIFILNEGFENNNNNIHESKNELIIDKRHRITFNKLGNDYNKYINNYVPTNSIESIHIKTGFKPSKKYEYKRFISKYKEHLVDFSHIEQTKLAELISEIIKDPKFNRRYNSKYSIFISDFASSMKWNLLKTRNLELNLPCTISNYILFPESQLKTKNWDRIKETLMHEQIHILQRQYQDKFNEFYKQLFNNPRYNNTRGYGYHLLPIKKKLVDYSALEIEHIQIQNPDEDDTEWLIYDHYLNGYYIVPYIVNRNLYKNMDGFQNNTFQKSKNNSDWMSKANSNIKTNSNSKNMNMPNVSTLSAFKVDVDKTLGPHTYVVTGKRTAVQGLEYSKYLTSLTNDKHINTTHPNETLTDLFLII